jgi:hypothetical protein
VGGKREEEMEREEREERARHTIADSSLCNLSVIPGNIVDPPESTTYLYKS